MEVAAIALDVFVHDQAFDDRGAGGGGAESAFAHGLG